MRNSIMEIFVGAFWTVLVLLYVVNKSECSTTISSHTDYNCTQTEYQQAACLNGGVCFVTILDHRHPACHCPLEYTGKRCHEINVEVLFGAAEISVIVVLSVVLLVLVGVALYIYHRRKRKLPLWPCTKQEPTSINKDEEEVTVTDKMLNGEDKTAIEMDTSH